MLDLEADTQAGQTPYVHGQTPSRGSLGGTSSKLRDSCQACAMSKVKCPKEKPSCSRCESRGITCQYFFTRRPGRRRENSTSSRPSNTSITANSNSNSNSNSNTDTDSSRSRDRDTVQAMEPSLGACFLSGSTTVPTSLSVSNNYLGTPQNLNIPTSPRPDNMFAQDFSDVFSVFGETSMFPGLADFGSDVISGMDSPFGLPVLDNDSFTEKRNDIVSLLIPAEGINNGPASSETSSAVDLLSVSSGASPITSNVQALSTWKPCVTRATDTSSCGCLMQALDLLKMLSSAPPCPRTAFAIGSPDATAMSDTINDSLARSVLIENKQTIEAVNSTLACPSCTEDNFLLTLSFMIVLKILERYATAARTEAEANRATRIPANNSIISSNKDPIGAPSCTYNVPRDDQGRGRMAAQLVLSELHRVQRLVNQLSPRLKVPKEGDGRNRSLEPGFWGRHQMTGGDEKMTGMAPFSAGTVDRVEADVRKSLSTLSAEIINVLRQS